MEFRRRRRLLILVLLLDASASHSRSPSNWAECGGGPQARRVRTNAGFDMAVYSQGDIVSNTIMRQGEWEGMVEGALKPYLTEGVALVDIGSNIGYHTFAFARTNDVFAFEPFAKNLALQNITRCLNPQLAARIRTIPLALSYRNETCELHQDTRVNIGDTVTLCGDGAAELAAARAAFRQRSPIYRSFQALGTTRAVTLDSIAPTLGLLERRKVVKIDVEGYEANAMRGARHFMTQGIPPIAVHAEVNLMSSRDKADFLKMMSRWGYTHTGVAQPSPSDILFVQRSGQVATKKPTSSRPLSAGSPDAGPARPNRGGLTRAWHRLVEG